MELNAARLQFARPSTDLSRAILLAMLVLQLLLVFAFVEPGGEVGVDRPPGFDAVAAPALPLNIERGAEVALSYARQWRPGARLVAATGRISWTARAATDAVTIRAEGWITYVFVDGEDSLSLSLNRTRGGLFSRQAGRWGSVEWAPLDLATYPKSSDTAILTAEIIAGQSFRNACPDHRRDAIVTPSRLEGRPVWTVTYRDDRTPSINAILIRVDAGTGEVVTRAVTSPPCEPNEDG